MKFKDVSFILTENEIDHKMVNDTLVVYPDGYTLPGSTGYYIVLGDAVYNHEDDFYDEFEFSDNFDVIPDDLTTWLNVFAMTNEHPGYEQ